jgi:hypothetical protein
VKKKRSREDASDSPYVAYLESINVSIVIPILHLACRRLL